MAKVSDIIESFILDTLGNGDDVNLSRNELADYFKCAPSQINYVLSTRFNLNRGFIITSQRGGGGYIKIVRIKNFDNNYLYRILDEILSKPICFKDALYLLEDLTNKGFISDKQAKLISYAISDRALNSPIKIEDNIRANILKNILVNLLKEKDNE